MSTRTTILVKNSENSKYIYHHHDGYPEGVGYDLKTFLEQHKEEKWNYDNIYNSIISGKIDEEYEPTDFIHGDSEYVYVIDTDERTLKCYEHHWDEGLKCINSKNEVKL